MTKPDDRNLTEKKLELLWSTASNLTWSENLHHWIGYGFIGYAFLDLMETFVPPNFTNSQWEWQTFGALVEQVVVPLVGLAFVFMGKRNNRPRWELPILRTLSMLTLIAGVLYFLLIPLGISSTIRINQSQDQQFDTQLRQTLAPVKEVQKRLSKVTTREQMEQLLNELSQEGRAPKIEEIEKFSEIKQRLKTFLNERENRLSSQAKMARLTQRQKLLKRSVKWNLGALISGVLFLTIWRMTAWARLR